MHFWVLLLWINCATEEHGESYIAYDAGLSEGEIGSDYKSDEDDYIMYEDLYVDETALADSLDVQLSTEEFTKYEITKPIVLDFHQIQRKSKCKMWPVSNGYPDESSI